MKVADLIAVLQRMPQDVNVALDAEDETGEMDTFVLGSAELWVNVGKEKRSYVFLGRSNLREAEERKS